MVRKRKLFLWYFAGGETKEFVIVRLTTYIEGLVASTSILMEQKQRRSGKKYIGYDHDMYGDQTIELALYVLPRAADSVFMIMEDRRLLSGVPFGDVLLFCASMGSIIYCFQVYNCWQT